MDIRALRLRMGWTPSDLARRLGVQAAQVEGWEHGDELKDSQILNQLEFLCRQAEMCCDEIRRSPLAESQLDKSSLDQIRLDRIDSDKESLIN